VSAAANSGYPFSGFTGGLTGTNNPQNVTMTAPTSVTAIFGSPVSLDVSPADQSINAGDSAAYAISLTPIAGWTGQVSLSGSCDSGLTPSFSSTLINVPGDPAPTMTVATTTANSFSIATCTIVGGPASVRKPVTLRLFRVEITTNPTGVGLTVTGNGGAATAAPYFPRGWILGNNYGIGTPTPQTGTDGVIYQFSQWSDGVAANPRTITVTQTPTVYTAVFGTTTLTISGQVTLGGVAMPNITVNLSGSRTGSTTTNSTGNYTFSVPAGGTYTVAPVSTLYTFQPPTTTYSNLTASAASSSPFAATPDTFTISGQVTKGGAGFQGVTVQAVGRSYSATTDQNGNYALQVPSGTYSIQASLSDYTFAPLTLSYTVAANQQGASFALALPVCGAWVSPANGGFNDAAHLAGGGSITFTLPVAGASGPADSVSFRVNGPNGYTRSLGSANFSGTFSAPLDLTSLGVGLYSATPIASNGAGAQTCTGTQAFFDIATNVPKPPGPSKCGAMTGSWVDHSPGYEDNTWNLTDNNGAISGTATVVAVVTGCSDTVITWTLDSTSSFNAATGAYFLSAQSPEPNPFCNGTQLAFPKLVSQGTLHVAPYCGMGTGNFYSAQFPSGLSDTLTATERDPTGESSTFIGWQGQYGLSAIGAFSMTLNPSAPSAVFVGRQVQETFPTAADNVPANFAANDGCYWPGAVWKPTQLITPALAPPWNVQSQNGASTYGLDYIGLYPQVVAWIQHYDPVVPCTLQWPLKMVINAESTVSSTMNAYGGPNTGLNLLQITINANSVSVSRGGANSQ